MGFTNGSAFRLLISILAILALVAACAETGEESPPADNGEAAEEENGQEATVGAEEPIKVGVILATSGGLAVAGEPTLHAIQALTEEANEGGGVEGREIELLVHDSRGDPTEASRAAVQVINEGAVVIIGATLGQETLAIGPIAANEEVPVLAPNATIDVTDQDSGFFEWVFRLGASDETMLSSSWDRMVAGGYERVAIGFTQDAYGQFGTDLMERRAEETSGVQIVESVSAALDATDVSAQATRIRDANPDVVALNTSAPAVSVAFLRSFEDLGLDVPMFGGIGTTLPAVLEAAGGAADGRLVAPAVYDPSDPTQEQEEVFALIEERGYPTPVNWSLFGVAGIRAVIAALEAGAGANGVEIRDVLASGIEVDGAHAVPLSFSEDSRDGYGEEGVVWLTVEGGEWQTLDN